MAKLSIKAIVAAVQSIAPGAKTASVTGTGVDLQGFDSALVLIDVGAWTDGSHTPKLQESDDNSTFTDVAAGDLDGSFTAITASGNGSQVYQVGYIGKKRYIRVYVTISGTTTGAVYGAAILKGVPRHV